MVDLLSVLISSVKAIYPFDAVLAADDNRGLALQLQ